MRRHPLDGARLKVVRAQEHLDALKAECSAFVAAHPYYTESEVYDEHWWIKPRFTRQPPTSLSAIVGDCITNARAALDYIMWELAEKYFHPPVDLELIKDDRRTTIFPIAANSATEQWYQDRLHRLAQRQLPTDAIAEIDATQPDVSGNPALGWLHQLVNHDKHRTPILTVGTFGETQIEIPDYRGRSWLLRGEAIRGGAAIQAEPELLAGIRCGDVKVNLEALVHVTCGDFSMPQVPLDWALEQIVETVAHIVPRFDPFFT